MYFCKLQKNVWLGLKAVKGPFVCGECCDIKWELMTIRPSCNDLSWDYRLTGSKHLSHVTQVWSTTATDVWWIMKRFELQFSLTV